MLAVAVVVSTGNRSVSNEDGDTSSGTSSAGYDAYQTGCIFAKLLGKHGGAGVAKVTATTVIHFATNQKFYYIAREKSCNSSLWQITNTHAHTYTFEYIYQLQTLTCNGVASISQQQPIELGGHTECLYYSGCS